MPKKCTYVGLSEHSLTLSQCGNSISHDGSFFCSSHENKGMALKLNASKVESISSASPSEDDSVPSLSTDSWPPFHTVMSNSGTNVPSVKSPRELTVPEAEQIPKHVKKVSNLICQIVSCGALCSLRWLD